MIHRVAVVDGDPVGVDEVAQRDPVRQLGPGHWMRSR
jgi:hypothetical protein